MNYSLPLILLLFISCAHKKPVSYYPTLQQKERLNDKVTTSTSLELAYRAYMSGCVSAFNRTGQREVHPTCSFMAGKYMQELEDILNSTPTKIPD